LPINIKVDRSFIRDVLHDEGNQMSNRAIISMEKSLKLNIIAEGVEEVQHKSFLLNQGCNEIHGYLNSYPLKAKDFEHFIKKKLLLKCNIC
jgi:EAL domain-containing protein (putative c-di-GMP-specific phosphodiesterase class I)